MHTSQRLTRVLGALALACAAGAFAAAAQADGSVSAVGMGRGARHGEMGRFDAVVQQYNASGERFRIDSHCQSACTIFLSIRTVCVTPNAMLLFHGGGSQRDGRMNVRSTQHMLASYNSALQQYLTDGHYMDTYAFHRISGHDIIKRFGYPACK